MKRNSDGRFTRIYNPVAKRVRVIDSESHARDPFDAWVQDTVSALARPYVRQPYDLASMAEVRKAGGLRAFAKKMLPHLPEHRLMKAVSVVEGICHAKQIAAGVELPVLVDNKDRGDKRRKRRVKRKIRQRRDALRSLKALLKK